MSNQKILVADDRPDDAALLTDILTSAHYDVVTAGDGEEALSKAYSERPELVILDIRMPKMDGYQVCQQLKHDPAMQSIPVILLTSTYRDSMDKVKGFEVGADDYVTQPVGHKELIARVNAVLRVKALYDERVRQQEAVERLMRELQKTNAALTTANEELARLSVTDALTGLYTRQHFFDRLQNEIARSQRFERPLAIIRVDISNFRSLNLRMGQPAGDAILRGVATSIHAVLREMDIAGRTGGDEFSIILPETQLDGAEVVATRLSKDVTSNTYLSDDQVRVGVNVGVAATGTGEPMTADELMQKADANLERSKGQGPGTVIAA